MRLPLIMLSLGLLSPGLLPAQSVAVRFTFDTSRSAAGEPAAVLAQREQMRAWRDTVEILLAQLAPGAGLRADLPSANYMASIVAAPVDRRGVRGVIIAVAVFEPGESAPWRYLAHFAAYAESAREAAGVIIGQTVASVSRPGP